MASEDSDQVSSGLPAIHRLGDLGDLNEPAAGQVAPVVDHPDDLRELLEARALESRTCSRVGPPGLAAE